MDTATPDPSQPRSIAEDRLAKLREAIDRQAEHHRKLLDDGKTGLAERSAARLQELKVRARAQAEQVALERADAGKLPPTGVPADLAVFFNEESAEDDRRQGATPADRPAAIGAPVKAGPAPAAVGAAAAAPAPAAAEPAVRPPASPARPRRRHWAVMFSFLLLVCVPTALSAWYMWNRATDRFVSRASFSVRTEEVGSAIELLGGVADLSGSSSNDPAILYSFIQSQEMVRKVNERLDLRALWAKADPEIDPIFAYHPPGTIEDMTEYWTRMVKVYNDDSGLLDLEVQAFTAEDAQMLAQVIYDESSQMINRLSAIARDDATGYAREELEKAVEELRKARVAMTRFRNRTQIVDPSASVQSQMGILSSLQQQLAEALIDLDILRQQGVGEDDPRVVQGERRVEVIEARIEDERKKLGIGGSGDTGGDHNAFAEIIGDYESLLVDLEFAEQSYTAARAAYEAAVAEARRQSRYLAAHVAPTLPERAELPNRVTLVFLTGLFAFLIWVMIVLSAYALRDRR